MAPPVHYKSLLTVPLLAVVAAVSSLPAAGQVPATEAVELRIVINEIMIDPQQVYDSRGEWIELYNAGTTVTNLAGWTLGDETYDQVVLPSIEVAPGQHVVLGRDADPFVNGGATLAFVYGNGIVLANAADRLILRNSLGTQSDRVEWGTSPKAPNGASLSRRSPELDGSLAASWCPGVSVMARGDLGTPGVANRCEASADHLVITEIMQNPAAVSDAQGEWFEVYNAGIHPVDLNGYTVKDDDYDRFTITSSVIVPAHGHAVLARKGTDNGNVSADYVYGDAMVLMNDTDELVLADRNLVQVDRVRWDNGATFPDPDGASMSLDDPASDNAVGANWCASTRPWAAGDRGTPGTTSWCLLAGQQTLVITEIMADPELPPGERAAEWFEVYNLGESVVDMSGWTITAGDMKTHTITSLLVAPNETVVLAASGDRSLNGDIAVGYVFGTNLPLYNATGRLILQSADGVIVDRVDWSAAAGFPLVPGHSMALRSPAADNALGANWCSSPLPFGIGDFGSPGVTNSCELAPPPPVVTISEVLRNPAAVGDSFGEWFEVHNAGAVPVDLRGWVLSDGASDRHTVRSSVVVAPGGYAVLGRTQDRALNGGAAVDYGHGDGFVLSNDADSIVLSDRYGQPVDRVSWQLTDSLRPNGASIARIGGGWCESGPQFGAGDRGTPGAPNDCTALPHPNVVINEMHIDPAAISDTVGEWIELLNAGSTPVDINGWVLRDDDYDSHTIVAGSPLVIRPGATVVLGRDTAALNGGAVVDYVYGSAMPLVEPSDEINLYDASLVPVDRVAWTTSRPMPHAPGASASLRSPTLDNADPRSWCRSVTTFGDRGELGTPRAANVCEVVTPVVVPAPAILALSPSTQQSDGLQVSGSSVTIHGSVRSNGNVAMSGSAVKVVGTISYGGTSKIGAKTTHSGLISDRTKTESGLPWVIADFAPGGRLARQPGYVSHPASLTVGKSGLAPGIHYVRGNITISGSAPSLAGVTLVATGRITISGSAQLSPASPALPALLAGVDIKLSGSSVTWKGVVAAPNGDITLSGSNIAGGRLVGGTVRISGSRVTIGT